MRTTTIKAVGVTRTAEGFLDYPAGMLVGETTGHAPLHTGPLACKNPNASRLGKRSPLPRNAAARLKSLRASSTGSTIAFECTTHGSQAAESTDLSLQMLHMDCDACHVGMGRALREARIVEIMDTIRAQYVEAGRTLPSETDLREMALVEKDHADAEFDRGFKGED